MLLHPDDPGADVEELLDGEDEREKGSEQVDLRRPEVGQAPQDDAQQPEAREDDRAERDEPLVGERQGEEENAGDVDQGGEAEAPSGHLSDLSASRARMRR